MKHSQNSKSGHRQLQGRSLADTFQTITDSYSSCGHLWGLTLIKQLAIQCTIYYNERRLIRLTNRMVVQLMNTYVTAKVTVSVCSLLTNVLKSTATILK